MIVLLSFYSSLAQVIRFSERKVEAEQAIYLGGFNDVLLLDASIDPTTKLDVLMMYARGNQNVSKPGLHIYLSFHPDEYITDTTLLKISQSFLDGIGYINQPFIVYRHINKNRLYISILTVNITYAGNRISDAFIWRIANRVRQETEITFKLIKAQDQPLPALPDPALPAPDYADETDYKPTRSSQTKPSGRAQKERR